MSDRVAIYPGSFDPPTNGHVDIVERSARLFDRVVVGVGRNLAKKTVFTADERIELMREACAKYRNVGIRALSDFEFEFEMANMNRSLAAEIEMVYLMTAPEFLFISASRVKELAAFGAPIDKYVPANVAKRLKVMGKRGMRTGATEAKD